MSNGSLRRHVRGSAGGCPLATGDGAQTPSQGARSSTSRAACAASSGTGSTARGCAPRGGEGPCPARGAEWDLRIKSALIPPPSGDCTALPLHFLNGFLTPEPQAKEPAGHLQGLELNVPDVNQ